MKNKIPRECFILHKIYKFIYILFLFFEYIFCVSAEITEILCDVVFVVVRIFNLFFHLLLYHCRCVVAATNCYFLLFIFFFYNFIFIICFCLFLLKKTYYFFFVVGRRQCICNFMSKNNLMHMKDACLIFIAIVSCS